MCVIDDPYILNRVLHFLDPDDLRIAARVSCSFRVRSAIAQSAVSDLATQQFAAQFADHRKRTKREKSVFDMRSVIDCAHFELLRWIIAKIYRGFGKPPCEVWSAIYCSFESGDQSLIARAFPFIDETPRLFANAFAGACSQKPGADASVVRQVVKYALEHDRAIARSEWSEGMCAAIRAHNSVILAFVLERVDELRRDPHTNFVDDKWYGSAVFDASAQGNYDFIAYLIAKGIAVSWNDVLVGACNRNLPNNVRLVRLAVANGARDDASVALREACYSGSAELVELCKSVGATPSAVDVCNAYVSLRNNTEEPGAMPNASPAQQSAFEYFERTSPELINWGNILYTCCCYADFGARDDDRKVKFDCLLLRAFAHYTSSSNTCVALVNLHMNSGAVSYLNQWCAKVSRGYLRDAARGPISGALRCALPSAWPPARATGSKTPGRQAWHFDYDQVARVCKEWCQFRDSSIIYNASAMLRILPFIAVGDLLNASRICTDMRMQTDYSLYWFILELRQVRARFPQPLRSAMVAQAQSSIETRVIISMLQYESVPWFLSIARDDRIDWEAVGAAINELLDPLECLVRVATAHGIAIKPRLTAQGGYWDAH